MKKFFALVLALVMALSLTTMAWGAVATNLADTDADGVIDLTATVTLDGYVPISTDTVINMNGFSIIGGGSNCVFYVTGGAKLTINGTGVETISVEDASGAYTIWSHGNGTKANVIEINNVTVKGTTWAVYHNGSNYGADVTINNSTVEGGDAGVFLSGSETWAAANKMNKLTITGSTIKGASAVEVKYGDVVVDNSALTATGTAGMTSNNSGSCASGYALALTHSGADGVEESAAGSITVNSGSFVGAVGIQETGDEAKGTVVAAETANTADATIAVKGGTFTDDVSAYLADGLDLVQDTNGNYVPAVVPAMGDKFDLYLANAGMNAALKAKTPDVAGLSFTEVAAKTNKDGSGNVAYIAANNGQFFVKTSAPTVSDYAVTDAGKTTVLYYVTVAGTDAANFAYEASVTAFNKFSTYDKCGYVTVTPAAGDVYFQTVAGDVYLAGAAGTGTNYLLNGKVVSAAAAQTVVDHVFVANGYKYDSVKKVNVPTSALCTKCLTTSTAIYLDGKAPAQSTVKELTTDTAYCVVVGAVSSAPAVGGTVVESAKTFDAGIAMYVGMSVMAACGSAVVIGKKKD